MATPVTEEGIDLIVLARAWRRHYLFIIFCVLVCGGVASLYAFTATPMYRAEATISEVHDSSMGSLSGQLSGLASLAGVSLGSGGGPSHDAQAILKSRHLVEVFIQRYQLVDRVLYGSKPPHSEWRAVSRFRKDIVNVDEDRRNGTTTVSIYWRDPKEAAGWATQYIALANEVTRNRAADDSQRNIAYITEQLKQTSSIEVQKALYNLVESETKTLMLARGRSEYAFTTIDPAVAPEVATSPKRPVVILVGIILGLFAGTLIALARYKLARHREVAGAL